MTDRMIDLSDAAARLSVRHSQLVIEPEGGEAATVPLDDLAVLIVTNPRVRYTNAVLTGIANSGGTFVVCGVDHLPAAMLLPMQAHYVQAERFARQAKASEPTRKRLWKQIVQAKIRAQAKCLVSTRGHDAGLAALAARVGSGDPQNVEAQAARRYWPLLFDDPKFRRHRTGDGANRHLNYGYAVLRAIVARAICAAGMHPSFGLHHRNRYNPFCLADDLMEPYRPVVDRAVVRVVEEFSADAPLNPEIKRALLNVFTGRFVVDGEARTLFDLLARAASSLAAVLMGDAKRMNLPEL